MTTLLSSQAPWQAVRDHLQRGGPPSALLYAAVAVAALAGLLVLLHRLQQRRATGPPVDNPTRLFETVIRDLGLNVVQRDLLRRMAADLEMEHPTVLLLSPAIFVERARRWTTSGGRLGGTLSSRRVSLEEVGRALFGSEVPAGSISGAC